MDKFWEGVGGVIMFIFFAFVGFFLVQTFWDKPSEIEGVVKYADCRQTINLKEGDSETPNKKFVCNYSKTQSGKIMGGECVYTETENGVCTKAFVYYKKAMGCQNVITKGVWYPYLGYDDMCYATFQAGNSVVVISEPLDLSIVLPKLDLQTSDSLPTEIGQCVKTKVKEVGTRLNLGKGSAISYENGGYQVSYDEIPNLLESIVGDEVGLCLISIPQDCPEGDERGKVYSAINLRTGKYWQTQDSSHSCGGA